MSIADRDEAASTFIVKKGEVHSQACIPQSHVVSPPSPGKPILSSSERTSIVRWRNINAVPWGIDLIEEAI